MSRLLAQLLMLARADANKLQFEIEKFDFSELAEIVLEETEQLAAAKTSACVPILNRTLLLKATRRCSCAFC